MFSSWSLYTENGAGAIIGVMGIKENRLITAMLLNPEPGEHLFRINSGMAWTGEVIRKTRDSITLKNHRPFKAAEKGTSDLLGWTEKTITDDMVGEKIAVFTAKEVKTGKLTATDEQKAFLKSVNSSGGIGEVIRVGS